MSVNPLPTHTLTLGQPPLLAGGQYGPFGFDPTSDPPVGFAHLQSPDHVALAVFSRDSCVAVGQQLLLVDMAQTAPFALSPLARCRPPQILDMW
jgi:hypothetical protein